MSHARTPAPDSPRNDTLTRSVLLKEQQTAAAMQPVGSRAHVNASTRTRIITLVGGALALTVRTCREKACATAAANIDY